MKSQPLLVFTTMPDKPAAEKLAHQLLDQRLAACVNILGEMTSIYHWRGSIQKGEEYALLIKTTESSYDKLQTTICSLHPYELPEIIATPITQGLPDYLDWINVCTKK